MSKLSHVDLLEGAEELLASFKDKKPDPIPSDVIYPLFFKYWGGGACILFVTAIVTIVFNTITRSNAKGFPFTTMDAGFILISCAVVTGILAGIIWRYLLFQETVAKRLKHGELIKQQFMKLGKFALFIFFAIQIYFGFFIEIGATYSIFVAGIAGIGFSKAIIEFEASRLGAPHAMKLLQQLIGSYSMGGKK